MSFMALMRILSMQLFRCAFGNHGFKMRKKEMAGAKLKGYSAEKLCAAHHEFPTRRTDFA
jgi:hypothetical protein